MSSPEIRKVLKSYDRIFQRLYCQPIAILLVEDKERIVITGGRKVAVAYCTIFLMSGCIGGGSSAAIIGTALLQGGLAIPPWKIGVQLFFFTMCTSLPVIISAVMFYRDVILCFWNYGVTLQGSPTHSGIPSRDNLGISLRFLLYCSVLLLTTIPFFVCYFQLDPFVILATVLFPEAFKSLPAILTLLLNIARFVGVAQVSYQLIASLLLAAILTCVSIRIFANAIRGLKTHRNILEFLRRFIVYRYLIQLVQDASGIALWMITSLTCILTVFGTFAAVKLYAVIPYPVFLVAPFLMIICPIIAFITIFPVVDIHEGSVALLHSHKNGLSFLALNFPHLKRKYFLWRLRATRPLTFYAGISEFKFFKFKRSLKKSYLEITLYFTITFILSVPIDSLLLHHGIGRVVKL